MSKDFLSCIVCKRELEPAMPGIPEIPYGGTVFNTYGHYGSTIWDNLGSNERLEVVICDVCIIDNSSYFIRSWRPVDEEHGVFSPTEDEKEYVRSCARNNSNLES